MALTATAKFGSAGMLIIGAILGPSFFSSGPIEHPANVQGLLNWEQSNGGCKVFMAIERDKGKLYRPGEAKKKAITDAYIDNLLDSLTSGDSVETNKNACANKKEKALVFARRDGAWVVDTKEWKNKGGDVEKYPKLFKD